MMDESCVFIISSFVSRDVSYHLQSALSVRSERLNVSSSVSFPVNGFFVE